MRRESDVFHTLLVCPCSGFTAADIGLLGSSDWPIRPSAHGFPGSSVEQQEEQEKRQEQCENDNLDRERVGSCHFQAFKWCVSPLQVLPVASESRLTIVDLVKSLNTLHTDTILQLVKEVVKKPHQLKGDQVLKRAPGSEPVSVLFPPFRHISSSVLLEIEPGRYTDAAVHLCLHQEVSSKAHCCKKR